MNLRIIENGFTMLSLALFVTLIFSSCSVTKIVEPLPKGEKQLGFTAGGPISSGTGNLPLPLTGVYYANGITSNTTVTGGVQVTSALFENLHLDGGLTMGITENNWFRPGFSMSLEANGIYGFREDFFRVYPIITPNLYWNYNRQKTYIGVSNWLDFWNNSSSGSNAEFWIPTINLGNQFGVKDKWSINVEGKFLAPNIDPQGINGIEPVQIQDRGGVGIYLGVSYAL
ncbi:MAG: hypothetical protein MRY83_10250 [Flavobacteriales bacterium]|nr:hypothetical protein [Flavobacteriales bacterium]